VIGQVRWERRLPITAKIRCYDLKVRCELRRDSMPCRVRSGMAVQQHDRLPLPAMTDAKMNLAKIDALQREPVKHSPNLPIDGYRALEPA
jgi:hypothetical protein